MQSVDKNVMFKTKMQEPPHPDLRRVEGLPTADGFTGCKRSEASSFSESEGCCGCAFFSRLRLAGFGVAAGGAAAGCAAGCSGLVFTAAGLALGSGCCSAAAAAAGGAPSMGSPCRSAASPAGVAAAAGAAGVPVTAAVGAAGPPGSASAAGDASCGEASLLTLRPRPLPRPPRPRPLPLPLPLPPLPSHGATQASQIEPTHQLWPQMVDEICKQPVPHWWVCTTWPGTPWHRHSLRSSPARPPLRPPWPPRPRPPRGVAGSASSPAASAFGNRYFCPTLPCCATPGGQDVLQYPSGRFHGSCACVSFL